MDPCSYWKKVRPVSKPSAMIVSCSSTYASICPPGYSYAKYLSTYGSNDCEGAKSYFPYEYVDSLEKLDKPLPPYESFFSTLRRGNTLDEDRDKA